MIYYCIFILRRMNFCLIAFYIQPALLQVQAIMLTNLFMIIYQGSIKPFVSRSLNNFELFNEVSVTLITMHDIFFTDILDREVQMQVGWSMILIMLINMVVNIQKVFKLAFTMLYLVVLKYYRLMRRFFNKDYMRGTEKPIGDKKIIPVPTTADNKSQKNKNKELSKKKA